MLLYNACRCQAQQDMLGATTSISYAPVADPQQITLNTISAIPLTLTGYDANGYALSFGIVAPPSRGVLGSLNASTGSVTYTPPTELSGSDSFTFSVTSGGVTSLPATVTIVLEPPVPLTVSPTSLSYGNQGIASTSAAKKVTITNNTGAVVTISSIAISGTDPTDFAQSATTCGSSLALKSSCTISIAFTPTALGARSAALVLLDSAANSPQTIALSGTGVLQASLSPVTLAFGNEADGTTTAPKTVTLTNNTSAALPISSIATTGTNSGEFAVSSNACGASIGAHSSCKIGVTFAPVTPGAKTASLTVTDSANNSPQSVSLTGTGIAPVSITPASLTFAAQKVGTTSAGKKVTIKNNLKATLTFSGFTLTGANTGDFSQSTTTCGGTLGAGLTCTVSITFTPTAKGSRTADLSISDSATTSPQTVVLSGTGK